PRRAGAPARAAGRGRPAGPRRGARLAGARSPARSGAQLPARPRPAVGHLGHRRGGLSPERHPRRRPRAPARVVQRALGRRTAQRAERGGAARLGSAGVQRPAEPGRGGAGRAAPARPRRAAPGRRAAMTGLVVTASPRGARFKVRAAPGSKVERIVGVPGAALKVAVRAPPERGRANERLLEVLAAALALPVRSLTLVCGDTARDKVVEVAGLTPADVLARLRP